MPQLTRRMQILLDERRHRLLRERAAGAGTSVGALVREAIDRAILDDERHAAGAAFLSAEPMALGEWSAIEREIEEAYARASEPGGSGRAA